MKIKAASKRRNQLGEGPHWDVRSATIVYVDALAFEVIRFDPQTQAEAEVVRLGKQSAIVPVSQAHIASARLELLVNDHVAPSVAISTKRPNFFLQPHIYNLLGERSCGAICRNFYEPAKHCFSRHV